MSDTARRSRRVWPRMPAKLLVAGVIILLAAGYLVVAATSTSSVYYLTVRELQAQGDQAYGKPIRVAGWVVDGSIRKEDNLTLRFSLTDGQGSIPVVYKGVVPDLFGYSKDDMYQEVVVEGRYNRDHGFVAGNLIVKHGPEFRAGPEVTGRASR